MFPDKPNDLTRPETYSRLKASKTTVIKTDDYDVFGDGTVVLKLTPGHTVRQYSKVLAQNYWKWIRATPYRRRLLIYCYTFTTR